MPNKEEVRKKLADLIENKGLNFRKVSLCFNIKYVVSNIKYVVSNIDFF